MQGSSSCPAGGRAGPTLMIELSPRRRVARASIADPPNKRSFLEGRAWSARIHLRMLPCFPPAPRHATYYSTYYAGSTLAAWLGPGSLGHRHTAPIGTRTHTQSQYINEVYYSGNCVQPTCAVAPHCRCITSPSIFLHVLY